MIAVIDYGMGNLRSVQKGFEKVGVRAFVTSNPVEVDAAQGVVLPGVGAFRDAMNNLLSTGLAAAFRRAVDAGKPVLGICLGFQLLLESSEEWGITKGLGIIAGKVRRLPRGVLVPHMGWNQVKMQQRCPLTEGIFNDSSFYFVHSYFVDPQDRQVITGTTCYGIRFASMIRKENVFGVQFHPEKSSLLGLNILKNFGRLVEKC